MIPYLNSLELKNLVESKRKLLLANNSLHSGTLQKTEIQANSNLESKSHLKIVLFSKEIVQSA